MFVFVDGRHRGVLEKERALWRAYFDRNPFSQLWFFLALAPGLEEIIVVRSLNFLSVFLFSIKGYCSLGRNRLER